MSEFKKVVFKLKERAGDCSVELDSGEKLGLVQSVEIKAQIGSFSTAKIETICNLAEVEVLQRDTELIVTIKDHDEYMRGYNDAIAVLSKIAKDNIKTR